MRKSILSMLALSTLMTPMVVMADTGVLLEDIQGESETLQAGTQVRMEKVNHHTYRINTPVIQTTLKTDQLLPITETKTLHVTTRADKDVLYTKPSPFSPHLLIVEKGEKLYPSGPKEDGWLKVVTENDVIGWILEGHVEAVTGEVAVQTKAYVKDDTLAEFDLAYGDDVTLMFADATTFTLTNGQVVDKDAISLTPPPQRVKFVNPLPTIGRITSHPGYRTHPVHQTRRYHKGVDVAVPTGTPVSTTMDGMVTKVSHQSSGYGYHVEVTSGPYRAVYAHLSDIHVSTGQRVSMGERLGLSGNTGTSTGPHLHFELWKNGQPLDTSYLVKQATYNQSLPLAP